MPTDGISLTGGFTPLSPEAAQSALQHLAAINFAQQAPDMLKIALQTEGPEADEHLRQILSIFPDLMGKFLPHTSHTPLSFALYHGLWGKAALLISLGASTTGMFTMLYNGPANLKIPELADLLETLFQQQLATNHEELELERLVAANRPDWAWQLVLKRLEKSPAALVGYYEELEFVLQHPAHLTMLLASPDVEWPPHLVGENAPIESWQLIAQQRPELLALAKPDGTNLLHVVSAEWIEEVADRLPNRMLRQMLTAKTEDHYAFTPWLQQIRDCNLEAARALWALVQKRGLRVDLAAQRATLGSSALHLAFRHTKSDETDAFIRWLMDTCGLDPRDKTKGGTEAWEFRR